MKRLFAIVAGSVIGLGIGHAKLPAPSGEQKAAAEGKAQQEAAAKAKAAKELAGAQERAAENYRRNRDHRNKPATGNVRDPRIGANHAEAESRGKDLTRHEAQTEMPTPGQANDHSTTARDPANRTGKR